MKKTEEEWKKELTDEQYKVLREKGTETPFSGKFLKNKDSGVYTCGACGKQLFDSDTKFESGTGWPSFYDVMSSDRVILHEDDSHGMTRTEVVCANCGSHLGHVFDDGPTKTPDGKPCTGKRFCINSAALGFEKDNKKNNKPPDLPF